ncbi:MAG: hypothetical protein O3C46_06450 [Bacteroidetes bacterium]|jgi:hypothetical protein|nr:hypothetical protein [Bacteroidota bacterium]MDA0930040.1 hypothetical protein [Bacteroidota bacterium]
MKLFFTLIFAVSVVGMSAQNSSEAAVHSCYQQWAAAFDARGAEDVSDGWHEDVVVSIRYSTGKNDCWMGKVEVKGGKIQNVYLKYVDNKYEHYQPEPKKEVSENYLRIQPGTGISSTLRLKDDTLVNVVFKNKLKPKKKSFQQAPLPNLDDL